MALFQSTESNGSPEHLPHFTHLKTKLNERWECWIAGPCHWYDCHSKGKTKPCLLKVTGGALSCPLCSPLNPIYKIGYQPVYRCLDSKPGFIVLHDHLFEPSLTWKLHQRVTVGRLAEKTDGVFVTPMMGTYARFETRVKWKMSPVDIEDTLLRVWAIDELCAWAEQNRGREAAADPRPALPAPAEQGEPMSPMMRGAQLAHGAIREVSESDVLFDETVNRLRARIHNAEAKPNGKHKSKPK